MNTVGYQSRKTLPPALAGLFAIGLLSAVEADVVIQYSFEGSLDDTATAGTVSDHLSYNQGVSNNTNPAYVER